MQKAEAMSLMFTKEDLESESATNKKILKNLIPVLPPWKQNAIPLMKAINEIRNSCQHVL